MSNPQAIFVRPREGVKVFDPATKDFLPGEGREVAPDTYWSRREIDGDISIVQPAVKSTVKTPK